MEYLVEIYYKGRGRVNEVVNHTSDSQISEFAEACYNGNTIEELEERLRRPQDYTDMREWNLSEDEWIAAIRMALKRMKNIRIGVLADNFNRLAKNLKESFEKIEVLNKDLLAQLLTDPLTNIPNRKKFIDDLSLCSHPVVIIFNVDCFQETNDFYGTEVGDLILKELACRFKGLNLG